MTDTNNTWPGKPGVPLNPEKDGWHWVRRTENNMPFPLKWTNDWTGSRDYCWAIMGSGEPEDVAKNFCYLGPVLSHDEATALQARVAELEEALRNIEADCCSDCPPSHGAIKYACRDALERKKDE